jgi:hypothetical protein
MSKEFCNEYENEPLRFEEDGEQHQSGDADESRWIHKEARQPAECSSLIRPDTG